MGQYQENRDSTDREVYVFTHSKIGAIHQKKWRKESILKSGEKKHFHK